VRRAGDVGGDEQRRAGAGARDSARFVPLTCRPLSERSARSARSELGGAAPARAAQCSRREATTAAVRRPPDAPATATRTSRTAQPPGCTQLRAQAVAVATSIG
jgi:hypothetical protein